MDASKYTVTTLYGWIQGYPLHTSPTDTAIPPKERANYKAGYGFHTGVDYGCPVQTPVMVNGEVIGVSGMTGAVTGAHLHVSRYYEGYCTAIKPGDGFNVSGAVVFDYGFDNTNGNFVRIQDADGSLWVYCHLNSSRVTKGQSLKGGNMPTLATKDQVDSLAHAYLNDSIADNPGLLGYVGQPIEDVIKVFNVAEERANYLKQVEAWKKGSVNKQTVIDYINGNLK